MSIDLSELLKGKSTIIKEVSYLETKEYINPFIDKFKDKNYYFKCYTKQADQVSVSNGNPDIVYNRVLIMAIENTDTEFKKAVCMAYGLDVKVPVFKFFVGAINSSDYFLVFDENLLSLQKIEEGKDIDYSIVDTFINQNVVNSIKKEVATLQNTLLDWSGNYLRLGKWIDFTLTQSLTNNYGKVKISNTFPIEVYNKLYIDKDSDYYVNNNPIETMHIFNVYASLLRTDKDILNRFEKTILIQKLIKL